MMVQALSGLSPAHPQVMLAETDCETDVPKRTLGKYNRGWQVRMTCQRMELEDTGDSEQESFTQKAEAGCSLEPPPATHRQTESYSEVPLQESSVTAMDQFFL